MANVTRRRTGEFLRLLFQILNDHGDAMPARNALDVLRSKVTLTDYEKGTYASGGLRFEKIVRFATVDCVKAGWMRKLNGKWTVTEAGTAAFKQFPDPEDFYREATKLYRAWKNTQLEETDDFESSLDGDADGDGNKVASITLEEAEEQAWSEVENYLHGINPYDFQDLVGDLIEAMGYHVAWIAPPGKDGGVDILALKDPLGTQPPRIKVQVKRQKQTIAVDGLRSFMAILSDEDVGLFVSLGGFTKDAELEARTQEKRRVTLVDLEKFFELWIEYYAKLSEQARQRLPIKPVYFLAPKE